jgi:hypothetical protein
MKEITYFNEGEVYRESEPPTAGASRIHNSHFIGSRTDGSGREVLSNYYNLSFPLPKASFNYLSRKTYKDNGEIRNKLYYKSEWYAKQYNESDWMDIPDGIDACPAINKFICVGVLDNEVDLFFDLEDADMMQVVSEYYKLPMPLKKDVAFTGGEHNWNLFYLNNTDVAVKNAKMAAIKFIDNQPTYFKFYKYVPS